MLGIPVFTLHSFVFEGKKSEVGQSRTSQENRYQFRFEVSDGTEILETDVTKE